MSFTIYTAGDATFLTEVFNSVAMVSGSGAIASVAAVGALVTVILLGFRAILEGGRAIRFEELLLGFVVYMIAFYPTTTVLVEDGYTGHVYPVDNVPFGPAAAGWAVSSIGYKLTTIFETGYRFSAHGSDDSLYRFAEPLELLMRLRSTGSNPLLMNAINTELGPHADFRRSWENYYKDCTLIKVSLGLTTPDAIIHGNAMSSVAFESEIYGTQLFLGIRGGSEHTCADAYRFLVEALTTHTAPGSQLDQIMHSLITKGANDDEWGSSKSAADILSNEKSSILGYSVNVQEYVQATILNPIFNDAVEGRYREMQDVAAAIAFRQSIMQRNTQWSQEASAFLTVIRPAMTFFEGFVYAVTPMLAMLLVMGRFGMTLAGKYLQTIFWVQLWLPILSICNLYIRNAAEKQINATFAQAESFGSVTFESFYMVNNIPEIAESWLATGSMLAASTPMLAFFLISGSSFAFSNIAGRLGGQDHFDEKQVAPDAVKVGAVHDASALMKHTPGGGGYTEGSQGYTPEISLSEGYDNQLQQAITDEKAAQVGFQNTFSQAFKTSVGQGNAYSEMQSLMEQGAFSTSQTKGFDESQVEAIAKKFDVSSEDVKQSMMKVGAAAQLGFKIPGTEIGAGLSAEKSQSWSNSEKKAFGEAISQATQSALSNGMGTSLMDQVAEATVKQGGQTFTSGMSSETADQLTQSAQQYRATREQTSRLSSQKDGFSDTQKFKYNEVGGLIHKAGLGGQMASIIGNDKGLIADANKSQDMFQSSSFGWSEPVARNAGMFNAIMQNGSIDQKVAALGLLAESTGRSGPQGQAVDTSHVTGVGAGEVQKRGVRQLDPGMSLTMPEKRDLGAEFEAAGKNVEQTRTDKIDRGAAMEGIAGIVNNPVPFNAQINKNQVTMTPDDALALAMGGFSGEALGRAGSLNANSNSGRSGSFDNELAPMLSPGAASYLQEVRLGGNHDTYVGQAYQNWRDEFAVPDANGNIERDASGSAILTPENEQVLAANKAVLDRHQYTNDGFARTEIGALSMHNKAFGIEGQGREAAVEQGASLRNVRAPSSSFLGTQGPR